ncbi:unnamed protein product [Ectocarpus sp. 6 AP-2014]
MPSSPRPSSASPPSTTAPSTSAPAAPVTPPAIATSARRPGRPRKSPPDSREPSWICPTTGDIADDIIDSGVGAPHDFSVTIGNRSGANMKDSLFNEGCAWMTKRAVRSVTSMERGDMNENLHLQGIWTLALKKDFGDSKKEEAASRRKLRVDCGWTAADKDYHQAHRQATDIQRDGRELLEGQRTITLQDGHQGRVGDRGQYRPRRVPHPPAIRGLRA